VLPTWGTFLASQLAVTGQSPVYLSGQSYDECPRARVTFAGSDDVTIRVVVVELSCGAVAALSDLIAAGSELVTPSLLSLCSLPLIG
jgi:hypothetical protein